MTCGDLLVATRTCQDTVATRETSFAKQLLIIIIIVYVEGCTHTHVLHEGIIKRASVKLGITRSHPVSQKYLKRLSLDIRDTMMRPKAIGIGQFLE